MFTDCKPQAGPRIYQVPYGIQFLEERERKRIRVMMGAGNQNWRFFTSTWPQPASRRQFQRSAVFRTQSANGRRYAGRRYEGVPGPVLPRTAGCPIPQLHLIEFRAPICIPCDTKLRLTTLGRIQERG
jgi:hypothetical protein